MVKKGLLRTTAAIAAVAMAMSVMCDKPQDVKAASFVPAANQIVAGEILIETKIFTAAELEVRRTKALAIQRAENKVNELKGNLFFLGLIPSGYVTMVYLLDGIASTIPTYQIDKVVNFYSEALISLEYYKNFTPNGECVDEFGNRYNLVKRQKPLKRVKVQYTYSGDYFVDNYPTSNYYGQKIFVGWDLQDIKAVQFYTK